MASLRESVFKFVGDARPLTNEIKKVAVSLRDLPNRTSLEIDADIKDAIVDVDRIREKVNNLNLLHPEVRPFVNLKRLTSDVVRAQGLVKSIPSEKTIELKLKELDIKKSKIEARIERVTARVQELKTLRPELVVEAKVDQSLARIDLLENRIKKLKRKPQTFEVKAEITKAEADVTRLKVEVEELVKKDPRFAVDAEIDSAERELAKLQLEREAVEHSKTTFKVEADVSRMDKLQKAGEIVERVGAEITQGAEKAEKAVTPTLNLGGAFGKMSSSLRRLGPLISGVAIALVAALLPGIIAVVAALGAAVVAVGALATALGAALLPAVALLVPVFQSIAKVIQVYKDRNAALTKSHADARAAAEGVAQAESQVAGARNAVRDASEGVVTAERNLKEARQAAQEAIQNARQQNADAIREEKQAAEELAKAEVDAYRQIRDAIEDVKDARLDLADAKLGEKEAKLDTKDAQLNLKKLREQMGLAGDQFDSTFKKFEDANFDTSGLKKALKGAGGGGGAQEDPAEMWLKLQHAVLDVQKAQLNEKQAADRTKHAHQDLNDKIKEATRLQKGGIKAVDSYRAAQDRLRSCDPDAPGYAEGAQQAGG
jgi:DNA repair exonuclease SbcCD ATPase subunit